MIATLIAAALFLQAAPAATPAPPGSAAPAGKTVSPVTVTPTPSLSKRRETDPAQVVCTSETPLGSRFPVKTCATRSDRRDRKEVDQAEVRRWVALRPGPGD